MEALYTFLGGAIVGVLGFFLRLYEARKSADRTAKKVEAEVKKVENEARQSLDQQAEELRQDAQEFINKTYQRIINENAKDREEMQQELKNLQKVTSEEIHGLRNQLQDALIQVGRLEERNKYLEERYKSMGGSGEGKLI